MRLLIFILCFVSFGILEGSDVQGYELTSATWVLLLTCIGAAMYLTYKVAKKEEWR